MYDFYLRDWVFFTILHCYYKVIDNNSTVWLVTIIVSKCIFVNIFCIYIPIDFVEPDIFRKEGWSLFSKARFVIFILCSAH